jgi:hypothetical protein
LGSLNDFVVRLSLYLEECAFASPTDAALWLADTPCGAIAYDFPDQLTREHFHIAEHTS